MDLRSGGAALAVFAVTVGLTQVLPNSRGGVAAEVDPTGVAVLRGIEAGEALPEAPAPDRFGPQEARQVAGPDPLAPPAAPPAFSIPGATVIEQAPAPVLIAFDAEFDIPGAVVGAYRTAAELMAKENPGCGLNWFLLAGIGRIESDHAQGGALDATGGMTEPFVGPLLDGTGTFAEIRDSDAGLWDGDKKYDRALGPMQFLPGTWRTYGRDADGDGTPDPQNIHDSTLAAAHYLCASGADLRTRDGLLRAVFSYNRSWEYVTNVLTWAGVYSGLKLGDLTPRPTPSAPAAPTATPTDGPDQLPEWAKRLRL